MEGSKKIKSRIVHETLKKFLIYLVNILLVALIIRRVIDIDNDKAIILFLFYYPALFILNMVIGGALKLFKVKLSDGFMEVSIAMMILFFPIAYLLSWY